MQKLFFLLHEVLSGKHLRKVPFSIQVRLASVLNPRVTFILQQWLNNSKESSHILQELQPPHLQGLNLSFELLQQACQFSNVAAPSFKGRPYVCTGKGVLLYSPSLHTYSCCK